MGTKSSEFYFIYEYTKVISGMTQIGGRFITYDVEPNNPRKPMIGFATNNPAIAATLAGHFKQMEKELKKDAKEREKCGVKGFGNTLKKKAKSPRGSKKAKRSTTTAAPRVKAQVKKARKLLQDLG